MRVMGVSLVGVVLGGAVLAASACGAKPPEPLDNMQRLQPEPEPATAIVHQTFIGAPRPAIDVSYLLPDFHDELRWPLSGMNHPTLEPRFPIAQELAIGLDWEQLCSRGVHMRVSATQKELLSYLHGWCDVQKRDIDAACKYLTPLLGSVTRGLGSAVRQDLANILVEHGNAESAEHWLSKHRINDVATLDLLAANYVEVGSLADAFTINRRVIDSDNLATDATKCRRLVKRIVIGFDHQIDVAVKTLKDMVLNAKVADPTCERLWNKIACWRDHSMCAGYHNDENISPLQRLLLDAYDQWPSGEHGAYDWWAYSDKPRLALPTPGAAELVVAALEATLDTGVQCTKGFAASFSHAIEMVRLAPDHGPLEARIQRIEKRCSFDDAVDPNAPAPQAPAARARPPKPVATWPAAPTP